MEIVVLISFRIEMGSRVYRSSITISIPREIIISSQLLNGTKEIVSKIIIIIITDSWLITLSITVLIMPKKTLIVITIKIPFTQERIVSRTNKTSNLSSQPNSVRLSFLIIIAIRMEITATNQCEIAIVLLQMSTIAVAIAITASIIVTASILASITASIMASIMA